MAGLCVVILTHNEEKHIARALASVRGIAEQVFVIDSNSTDATVKIAADAGAKVLTHRFVNQAQQFQWGLDNAPITSDWIMRLDADEIIEDDLRAEIAQRLPSMPADVVGINLKRKHIFMDRWVRHGGRYPLLMLRIWRRGRGRIENRWMDEHMVVWGGRTEVFQGGFSDHNLNDLSYFIDKHNRYATREAIDVLNHRIGLFPPDEAASTGKNSLQTAVKRWVKEAIYNRMPYPVAASGYFIWRYVFQLGFLDGRAGLVYHVLQGFWYRFLVGAKVSELEEAVASMHDKDEIAATLARLTGFPLTSPIKVATPS